MGRIKNTIAGMIAFATTTSFIPYTPTVEHMIGSGINITSFTQTGFGEQEQRSLEKVLDDGFETLVLNPVYMQSHISGSRIDNTSQFSTGHMQDIISFAKEKDAKIILKPLVNTRTGYARSRIDAFLPNRWFESYTKIMLDMTRLADSNDVYALSVGCELDRMLLRHPDKFRSVIDTIRSSGYDNLLFYSSTFNDTSDIDKINILNKLPIDAIGVDLYAPVSGSVEEKTKQYIVYLKSILDASEKPVAIAELGHRSVKGAGKRPYDFLMRGKYDPAEQAENYTAFFNALESPLIDKDRILFIGFWLTDTEKYSQDISDNLHKTGYSPFGKPAEDIIKRFNDQNSGTVYAQRQR